MSKVLHDKIGHQARELKALNAKVEALTHANKALREAIARMATTHESVRRYEIYNEVKDL